MEPNVSKTRILLVDDQLTQIQFEQMLLGKNEYDFVIARNGLEAVEKAIAAQPDVILLDMMMPVMDGLDALRKIRTESRTERIPVIMVTTRSEMNLVEQAFVAGCTEYLVKPIDRKELVLKIKALTQFRKEAECA